MNATIDHSLLAVAMSTPDSGIAPPGKTQQGSFVSQIRGLKVGESCARVKTIEPSTTLAQYAEEGGKVRETLRSSVGSSLRVARESQGFGEFEVEICETLTTKRQMYLIAIVTRTA